MEDDGTQPPDAANDNSSGEAEGGEDVTPLRRLDKMMFDIARLIGRQMAREDFERLRAIAANDNKPRGAGNGEGEAEED